MFTAEELDRILDPYTMTEPGSIDEREPETK